VTANQIRGLGWKGSEEWRSRKKGGGGTELGTRKPIKDSVSGREGPKPREELLDAGGKTRGYNYEKLT